MRAVFTVVSLVVVLAIVGVLAKKQLSAGVAPHPAGDASTPTLSGTPQQQVQQFQKSLEGAMQQSRPQPDEAK